MKPIQQKGMLRKSAFLMITVILVMQLITGCQKDSNPNPPAPGSSQVPNRIKDSVLVVWIKPGNGSAQYLSKWIAGINTNYGLVEIQDSCSGCDNSLKLVRGPGIANYISSHPVRGEVSPTVKAPASGSDGPVYYCRNYPVKFNFNSDRIDMFNNLSQRPVTNYSFYKFPQEKVKVAVFDTGLDTTWVGSPFLYPLIGGSCIPGAELGWNFAAGISNTRDDHDKRHGTIVSRFIADQVKQYQGNPVEILTVKTHDGAGVSNLFKILCGFAYAKDRGVKIINASFGFYLPRLEAIYPARPVDPNVVLLREYVKYYLTNNNILLIAAAGNTDDINEPQAFLDHGLPVPTGTNLRDLEQVSFYPASLARDIAFPNVIAVTTIHPSLPLVSPNQNFSRNVVDIGVKADGVVSIPDGRPHYVFSNPASIDFGASVEGSSFATPIVTGKICANYNAFKHLLEPGRTLSKPLLTELFRANGIISILPILSDRISTGYVMTK